VGGRPGAIEKRRHRSGAEFFQVISAFCIFSHIADHPLAADCVEEVGSSGIWGESSRGVGRVRLAGSTFRQGCSKPTGGERGLLISSRRSARSAVGKGALSGWCEVIAPALAQGARLWPFDGTLKELTSEPGLIVAETYPHRPTISSLHPSEAARAKRSKCPVRAKRLPFLESASRKQVDLSPRLRDQVIDGFGSVAAGEDCFDAFMGVAKMIEVAKGRPKRAASAGPLSLWEGWILAR
jgi:hypothetical protein